VVRGPAHGNELPDCIEDVEFPDHPSGCPQSFQANVELYSEGDHGRVCATD
jgi:hypothetical protein